METINTVELRDENIYPDEKVLQSVLGTSYTSYIKVLELFVVNDMTHEWRYYRDGKAWLCKVQKKKKTIAWMSAWKKYIQATVYFPLRIIENVYSLDIDSDVVEKIKSTKNVGKSKPCIFEIRGDQVLDDFEKVMKLKIESR